LGEVEQWLWRLAQEGMYLALLLMLPALLAQLVSAALVGAFGAVTGLQEGSLSQAPRAVAVAAALLVASPWIGAQLLRFTEAALSLLPLLAR
jgi:flagellar biosynthetic protein FliQ